MASAGETYSRFKRLSPFYLFLLAISPFVISLLIHFVALFLSSQLTWSLGDHPEEEEIPTAIVLDGKREDGLKFHGTDRLDSFRADDKMVYPLPQHPHLYPLHS